MRKQAKGSENGRDQEAGLAYQFLAVSTCILRRMLHPLVVYGDVLHFSYTQCNSSFQLPENRMPVVDSNQSRQAAADGDRDTRLTCLLRPT